MNLAAVTVNVGSGPGNTQARTWGMLEWALATVADRRPALVFAQEVPTSGWLETWTDAGYQSAILGPDRGWRIRSALIADRGLHVRPLTLQECPTLWYHGTYLAAGLWADAPGGPCAVVSVHASPSPAEPERYDWTGGPVTPRHGGGDTRWTSRTLWDSDLVLATLAALAEPTSVTSGRLLAAGDFNESRLDDLAVDRARRGTWGSEYFTRAADRGLRDVSAPGDAETLETRGRLQLDHVLVSEAAAGLVPDCPAPALDPGWTAESRETLSDHVPVWFDLDVP